MKDAIQLMNEHLDFEHIEKMPCRTEVISYKDKEKVKKVLNMKRKKKAMKWNMLKKLMGGK